MNEETKQPESKAIWTPPERKNGAVAAPTDKSVEIDPNQMVMVAIERGYDPQYLSALMEERAKIVAENARRAFYDALSQFQENMPEIIRDKPVYNKDKKSIRYWYAPTETIVEAIKQPLGYYGLSYRTKTELVERPNSSYKLWVKASVIVYHRDGHQEATEFEIPVQQSEFMTYGQSVKSARTDANRIALCNALGIVTADPDDDGESASVSEVKRVMDQAREFDATNEQMLRYIGVKDWGDINDQQIKKLEGAVQLMREGATAVQIFGAQGAADALDQVDDNMPTPADVFRQLDTAKTQEDIQAAQDIMGDALKSAGHKRIGGVKLKQAKQRTKGGRKK